jgi:hypothetical protein
MKGYPAMATAIFYPVLAQIILTFGLLLWMALLRRDALRAGETTYGEMALDDRHWPPGTRMVGNCYRNQFELPVIFYVLCVVAFEVGATGTSMLLLAWAFVASRVVHAYIHTTSNDVKQRGAAFAAGLLIVLVMTVLLIGHLLFPAV